LLVDELHEPIIGLRTAIRLPLPLSPLPRTRPIYVQRRELDDARSLDDYTILEWVDAPGVRYVPVDGELALLPGLRLVPAPGHTRGMQVVVVENGEHPVVVGGDVAVWFGELDEPHSEGQLLVRALNPELVWLAHEHEPWRPRTVRGITPGLFSESSGGMQRGTGVAALLSAHFALWRPIRAPSASDS
jgi:glyoxylase-like metal-dependent hydrolase (beta-lactamase superfamily II)